MHTVPPPTTYSPGSNIYTRIPTRPCTAMGGVGGTYLSNDHQLKLSPNSCAESSLIIPTTSSSAYVYTSYANGSATSSGIPDNKALASNYVLYGTVGKKHQQQHSPNRVLGGGPSGLNLTAGSVTTPLISTTSYNGFGKTGLVTTTTANNYDEFISWEIQNSPVPTTVCIKGDAERTTIVWSEEEPLLQPGPRNMIIRIDWIIRASNGANVEWMVVCTSRE